MDYLELLKTHRQALHKIPELGRELPKTKAYLLSVLKTLDCEITEVLESGLCVYFDRGQKKTTAFRADMDALPVMESNTHDYISTHTGQMHACGHDGHMAMGLTFAQYVNQQASIPCNVLMIFQPAEETSGGARDICETGILNQYHVTRIFGIHLWPFLKQGVISSKPNAMMPRSSEVNVDIIGKTSHATAPKEGIDALYIGCRFIELVYSAHSNLTAETPDQRTIIQFCKMDSGTARNIISGKTSLLGTLRAFSDETFHTLVTLLKSAASQLEEEYHCKIQLSCSEGYPPVINHPALYESITPALEQLSYEEMPKPAMISEDYSFYGHYAPAVFFLLGTGTGIALHSTNFDFDETALLSGFELYQSLLNI